MSELKLAVNAPDHHHFFIVNEIRCQKKKDTIVVIFW